MSNSRHAQEAMLLALGPRKLVAQWPVEARHEWSERAAIMEYDGEMSRQDAEIAAYRDCLQYLA